MITEAKPTEASVATEVHVLMQAAYALEAERIGRADFPPLRESVADLMRSFDRFLVCRKEGKVVGALSFETRREVVNVTRLVVQPARFRQGIAVELLTELEKRLIPPVRLTVTTAKANLPAVCLYQRLGYAIERVSDSAEGIALIHLTKAL